MTGIAAPRPARHGQHPVLAIVSRQLAEESGYDRATVRRRGEISQGHVRQRRDHRRTAVSRADISPDERAPLATGVSQWSGPYFRGAVPDRRLAAVVSAGKP